MRLGPAPRRSSVPRLSIGAFLRCYLLCCVCALPVKPKVPRVKRVFCVCEELQAGGQHRGRVAEASALEKKKKRVSWLLKMAGFCT